MEKPKKVRATVIPDVENMPPRVYANIAVINHTNFDFTLNFLDFVTPIKPEGKDTVEAEGNIELLTPIVARIALPPAVIGQLIQALKMSYDQYLAEIEAEAKLRKEG